MITTKDLVEITIGHKFNYLVRTPQNDEKRRVSYLAFFGEIHLATCATEEEANGFVAALVELDEIKDPAWTKACKAIQAATIRFHKKADAIKERWLGQQKTAQQEAQEKDNSNPSP